MSEAAQQVLRLGLGFIASQALRVAVEFDIADRLAEGDKSAEELALATQTDADALYRVLRALAAEGVFFETAPRRFALTELGAALRSDQPGPREFVRMITGEPYLAFGQLMHSVRTGAPAFEEVFGAPRFDWLSKHPEQAAQFQRAMVALGQGNNEAVAEAYDFGRFARLVDVGGGHGQLLAAILARNLDLQGVLFDLPSGVAAAQRRADPHLARAEFVAGDFFTSVPEADGYILKKVIHDWDDGRALEILRLCRKAMVPHGKVLLAETLVPPGNEPASIKSIDMVMLAVTGGLERSEARYASLFEAAGLRLERVIATRADLQILEACAA